MKKKGTFVASVLDTNWFLLIEDSEVQQSQSYLFIFACKQDCGNEVFLQPTSSLFSVPFWMSRVNA